jgi:hypothetical protein
VLIDGRNLYDPAEARRAGFEYHSMGRESVSHHIPTVPRVTQFPKTKQPAPLARAAKTNGKARVMVN